MQSDPERDGTLSRPLALRDMLIVGAPVVVLGAVGNVVGLSTMAGGAIINMGYVLMIIMGARLLKGQGSNWSEIGLRAPESWLRTVLYGVGAFVAAVVVFVAMQTVAVGLLTALGVTLPEIDQSRFNEIEGNLPFFILLLTLAWTTIAFGEELFYRAFLITRMSDFTAIGPGLAILIAGILFGAAHFAEGPLGILSNGAFGMLFGWIYVRSGRNLWITIMGHGLINTLRFTLLYVGAA